MSDRGPITRPSVPSELLDPVVAYFRPVRVILFGSHARGTARPDSDIDLLVELDDDTPPEKLSARAVYESRRCYRRPVDIVVCRSSVLRKRAEARGSFAHQVLRDGIAVYERG